MESLFSDHYVSVRYRQYLEGFLLNRIPLLNRLKWRLLATASVLEGGLRQSNQNLIATNTPTGEETVPAGHFTGKPYVELGYMALKTSSDFCGSISCSA